MTDEKKSFDWERKTPGVYYTEGEYKGEPYKYCIRRHDQPTRWVAHDRLRQDEHGFSVIRTRSKTLKACKRQTFSNNHRLVKRELAAKESENSTD